MNPDRDFLPSPFGRSAKCLLILLLFATPWVIADTPTPADLDNPVQAAISQIGLEVLAIQSLFEELESAPDWSARNRPCGAGSRAA